VDDTFLVRLLEDPGDLQRHRRGERGRRWLRPAHPLLEGPAGDELHRYVGDGSVLAGVEDPHDAPV
jgi:hypothetical protein